MTCCPHPGGRSVLHRAKTETTTGLVFEVRMLDKVYESGRKRAAGFKESLKLGFDQLRPKWKHGAIPTTS